jgi:hypothetical protein
MAVSCVAGFTDDAHAVNLSSNSLGQALIYPYYTVNANQQTLLSVVNTTNVGKVVRVRFLEGYNGRDVLEFNLYLSRYDVWTATVFSLGDLPSGSGGDTSLAGIFTTDNSCVAPSLDQGGSFFNASSGYTQGYQPFLNYTYTGGNADSGPTSDDRTREGHIEVILMSDVAVGSELDQFITQVNEVPPNCDGSALATATGRVAPTLDPITGDVTDVADGGLFGEASIINVAEGTFYAYNAEALDGFTYVSLYTDPGTLLPNLTSVNDRGSPSTATSHLFSNGEALTSKYPGPDPQSRPIDAVTSLFMAENTVNDYVTAADSSIGTDWVVTFPTKRFYVDAQFGLPGGTTAAYAPFEELFGQTTAGGSCALVGTVSYDREGASAAPQTCTFCPCAPGGQPVVCLETNVIRFQDESILGTIRSVPSQDISQYGRSGWLNMQLANNNHSLYSATNGNVFQGLPIAGFGVTRYVNGFIPLPGGGNALANYTGVYKGHATIACTNGGGPCL